MDFQAVKGTRDFYPDVMRVRNYLVDAWRRVSLRNGFEEYDSPIFEYLDLFTIKSGQEIAEQLFHFTDRGGRHLAIRPEITPALARMVNARIGALPRPIKWFSVPRLCRAEQPQRGRLREFFQWNIDVIGSDSVLADAECIFAAVDFLREVHLTADDVVVRIGSRPLTISALAAAGVPAERTEAALAVLDKRPKLSDGDFRKFAAENGLTAEQVDFLCRFQDCAEVGEARELLAGQEGVGGQIDSLAELMAALGSLGAAEYCTLDLRIVRGLAYYTGVVYEIFDRGESLLRAVAGGGRYDNLLEVLGGPKLGATGFGMGDVVLGILLEEKGKLPELGRRLDFFVVDAEEGAFHEIMTALGVLRRLGFACDFSYKRQNLRKQLKEANRRNAAAVLVVKPGGEYGGVILKDMAGSGWQWPALDSPPAPMPKFFGLLCEFIFRQADFWERGSADESPSHDLLVYPNIPRDTRETLPPDIRKFLGHPMFRIAGT